MSGFEIAGLVLGAYPILYGTAKDLRGVLKKAKTWWFFEREFDDFVSELHKEYISFSQILEILLDPLDLTPAERRRLQEEPDCNLWHETHIHNQVRQRIQSKYHVWFMGQLSEMNTALTELHAMLPIEKIYLLDSTSVEAELFKLKRSFSSRKNELLAIVQGKNDALFQFLEKASHITRSNSPVVPSKSYTQTSLKKLSHLQSNSQRAFHFLQKKWACSCSQRHHCGVTVDDSDTRPSLNLLLSDKDKFTQIQLVFEVVIPPTPEPKQTKQEEITSLKRQISLKKTLKKFKSQRPHSTLGLGISALSIVSNPFSSERRQVQLEKAETKLRKKALPVISPLDSKTSIVASQVGPQQLRSATQSEIAVHTRRRVKFAEEHTSTSTLSSNLSTRQIDNVCEIAGRSTLQNYDASEEIGLDTRISLHVERQDEGQPLHQATVEEFILATPRRDKRMQIALAMLRSILCLGPSPWVPLSWDKSHLILIGKESSDPRPYFFKSSLLSNQLSTGILAPQADKTRASLFAIGVLLLELLFRETFEKQPFRAQFLDDKGQANEVTDLCAALQWHRRVGEECGYELSDAIRRCIVCAFDASPNLGDPSFIEAVWYGVVKPLENFLAAWNRDPTGRREM
ncbi:hypothetical protein HD806DRAFT_525384 [Xylariaceae sp. AK1471]|nr:hypothetical protein HD806DRAFT_525384 [Xylariaceae sp. AK1471]